MSNDTVNRVWVLDTASTSADLWSGGPVHIARMEWQPSAEGQSLIVKDRNANIIWSPPASMVAAASGGSMTWTNAYPLMPFNGFILHTMTAGGTLYVTTV